MSKPEISRNIGPANAPRPDEYQPQFSLVDWIERGGEDARLERILRATRQILIKLELLHRQRRIHGCLTPDIISVATVSDEIYLHIEDVIKPDDLANLDSIKDACYLAPEQTGVVQRSVTPATDLYAVGLIVYRMLTGDNPIKATSLNELLVRQMTWIPSSLRMQGLRIPRLLDEMVLRLVKRDSFDRYQKTSAVARDVDSILELIRTHRFQDGNAIGTTDTRERLAEPSMVGRASWIKNFVSRLDSDLRISHSPWIIQGAAGQGKTRLLREFENEASSRSLIVLRVAGTQGEHSRPLEAISALIQELKNACDKSPELITSLKRELYDHAESLQPLLPWLWDPLNAQAQETGPESFAGRRLKQALQSLILTLSRLDQRIVLLIDNLDRCDEMSFGIFVDWIQSQQRKLNGRLLLVASTSVDPSDLFFSIAGLLSETLSPLNTFEIVQILRSMAGDFPDEAVSLIADAAHGNPYLAISLLYGMLESGTAVPSANGWRIRSLSAESLQGLRMTGDDLTSRLQSLTYECKRLLASAAILGRNCELDEARTLARLSDSEAQVGFELAIQRQLIWTDSNRRNIGFVHESIRQGFLGELSPRDRVALHLRSARMIRHKSADRCFELANHFDAAGRSEQAVEYAIRAAKQSQLQYSYEHAIRFYRIALKWIPTEQTHRIGKITEELADVYLSKSQYESAESEYIKAIESTTDRVTRLRIKAKIGDVQFKRGRMKEAAACYVEALSLSGVDLPKTSSGMIFDLIWQVGRQASHSLLGLRAKRPEANPLQRMGWNVLSRLAHTYWFSRGPLWTLMAHLRGMNEAECYADSAELAKAYSEHAPVCSLLGYFRRADEYSRRSLRIREKMHDAWGKGQTLSYSSVVQLAATRFAKCVAESMKAVELLQKAGDAWETNMARYQGANAIYRLGRYREAGENAQQMHLSGIEIGDTQASGISLDILMRAAPSMVSESVVEEQAAISRSDAQSHAQTQLALAILRIRQGRCAEAVEILEGAIKCCRKAGHLNTYISPCYAWLTSARRMLLLSTSRQNFPLMRKRRLLTRRAVREALHVAKKYPADLPHAYREEALLHVLDGRFARAKRKFELSLSVARQLDSPMEEYESLRCMLEVMEDIGDNGFSLTLEHQARFQALQTEFADSIALINIVKHGQASLSLVDRFDKLLDDGRRIAGSLNREAIFTECCLAAQHLLRGQRVFLFEKKGSELHWGIAHHHAMHASVCDVPNQADYQRYILETCDKGSATIFSTELHNGLTHGSLLTVPIRIRDVIVACLAVEHAEIEKLFGKAELQVAEFIATLTGAALENAEGFTNLRDLNTNLEQRVAERTEELHEAMAVAVAASQAKSQFLATMSHEVRTPLNGILGMTRLALAKCRDSQQSNYLSTIQRSGESLLQLLNDLLDFSKLEAGKMTVESIPFDPRQMLGDVIKLMSAPAWQKGIEVITSFDPRLPEKLIGDGVRLSQIVANLVGNAIKFTSTGFIEIRAEVLDACEGQPARWKVSVVDTGIGIPKSKQASIFEAFSQADGTTTRRFGGTGLGLSISMELVKLMHGTIEVESRDGMGSQFTVILPLDECEADSSTKLHSCRLAGLRVLVLEPHPVARRSMETLLENWGATTVSIERWSQPEDGESIDLELFELAILSGPEARILAELTRSVGVVTWVADSPDAIPIEGTTALSKPVLPSELVRNFVELSPHARQPIVATDESVLSSKTFESDHRNQCLRVLVAEDGEINCMVLVGLLELLGHSVTVVENGLQATLKVSQQTFDICLMDLDMPEMDGVEATRVIRSQGSRLPIYAMTAHHDEHHANSCRDAGMNGYLTKPIQADQLKQILQSVSSRQADISC